MPSNVNAEDTTFVSLSIQEALDQAYKNNPELRKAKLTVEQSEIQKDDLAEMVYYIPGGGLILPQVQQVVNNYQRAEIAWNTAKKSEKSAKDKVSMDVITAYNTATRKYNDMENARIDLEKAKQQIRIRSLSNVLGLMNDFEYQQAKTGVQQLEEQYKYSQSQYEGAIASLRSLLGESESWQPVLSSKAILKDYHREDLSLELSRGISQSAQVWNAEAQMDMEKSREQWIIPGISSEMQHINTGLKEADYEQAKRDSKAQIQQLYYGIDSLVGQIAAGEKAYETAIKNSEIVELKYQLGLIPKCSIVPGGESLSSVQITKKKARLDLENLQAMLAQYKAQFAFLTGQKVYDSADWSEVNSTQTTNVE